MKRHRTRHGAVLLELEPGDLPARYRNHERLPGERFREPLYGRFWIEISPIATNVLGRHGRMLSASKQAYVLEHPDNEVWFNACVFTGAGSSSGSAISISSVTPRSWSISPGGSASSTRPQSSPIAGPAFRHRAVGADSRSVDSRLRIEVRAPRACPACDGALLRPARPRSPSVCHASGIPPYV
jgi:hypothetical protein